MPSDQEFYALKKRVEEHEMREREADLELRAKLLAIVAGIERKHGLGKYAKPLALVVGADQQREPVENRSIKSYLE